MAKRTTSVGSKKAKATITNEVSKSEMVNADLITLRLLRPWVSGSEQINNFLKGNCKFKAIKDGLSKIGITFTLSESITPKGKPCNLLVLKGLEDKKGKLEATVMIIQSSRELNQLQLLTSLKHTEMFSEKKEIPTRRVGTVRKTLDNI